MKQRAQALIPAIVAIFVVFLTVVGQVSLFTSSSRSREKLDLLITSLNETLNGCYAYATTKDWENYLKQIDKETSIEDGSKLFRYCINTAINYINKFYDWSVELVEEDLEYVAGHYGWYTVTLKISKGDMMFKNIKYSQSISISIDSVEIKKYPTAVYLEVNFTSMGFTPNYLTYEVYFKNEDFYEKVMSGTSLPVSGDKHSIRVGIGLKYLVMDQISFLLKCTNSRGVTVWVSGKVETGASEG
ncbi:MAG: hypothetical protein QXM43_00285 [Desulfurococcaceae archaeon]